MTRLLITGASGLLGLNLAMAAYSHTGRPNAGYHTAAMIANQGLDVIGVDINQSIIDTHNEGRIQIQESGKVVCIYTSTDNGVDK